MEAKGKSNEGVETFEEFYGLLQSEAVILQKKYQPQLRNGIKIAVDFVNSMKQDAKDGDVDVRVKIAPNDEDDLTEVLYNGNKARLAVPVEKMEDLEGLTVTKGDKSTTVHVFANHGEHVDLEQRLKEQVLNVAIDIRKNRLDIYKLELDGVNKNLAQLARDNGSPSKIAKSTEIKEGFEEKIRLLNHVYKDFG